jgi:3-mercaptopyruvate sulfurtransferase SseA
MSHNSAWKAEKLGYRYVKVFDEGFPGWMKVKGNYACVEAEYVATQIEANAAVLIDSRAKKAKYDQGHVPSAISIPDSEFKKLSGRLPRDLKTPLIFYCEGYT